MWYHEAGAMKSGLMTESLVALVMDVEAVRLESSLIRKSDHMRASPLRSLSFFSLPDVYMLFACLPKERSHLFTFWFWLWFCQSSFICMQQDVLPTAAFCICLVLC